MQSDEPRSGVGDQGRAQRERAVTELVRALSLEIQRYVDDVGRWVGMHRSDVAVIGTLVAARRKGQRMSPSEVAHAMKLSQAAVTALVDRLVRVGHVARNRDATDRRRVLLDLTETARETSAVMFAPLTQQLTAALADYPPEDLDVALRVLTDLFEAARTAQPPQVGGRTSP